MAQEIVLAGGKRTPFGDFGKSLKEIPLSALATHAAKACVEDAEISPEDIDHVVWGNVLPVDPDGYYVGRGAGMNIGMKEESCALQVNRACGSGTQAILTAAQQIMTGHGKIALAGGGENFSRGPFLNQKMRWGAVRGAQSFEDSVESVYSDPFGHGLSYAAPGADWTDLPEESGVAEAGDERLWFSGGVPASSWSLHVTDPSAPGSQTRITAVPAEALGGRARVSAENFQVQEGARRFRISGDQAMVSLSTFEPVDIRRETNGDVLLLVTLKVAQAPRRSAATQARP